MLDIYLWQQMRTNITQDLNLLLVCWLGCPLVQTVQNVVGVAALGI